MTNEEKIEQTRGEIVELEKQIKQLEFQHKKDLVEFRNESEERWQRIEKQNELNDKKLQHLLQLVGASYIDKILQQISVLQDKMDQYERRISPFSDLVVKAEDITKSKKLSHNTVSANDNLDKYVIPGKKKVLVTLESVEVLKHRKRGKKRV